MEQVQYLNAVLNLLPPSDERRVVQGLLLLAEREFMEGNEDEADIVARLAERRMEQLAT